MNCCEHDAASNDLVRSRAAWLLWCLPTAFIVVGMEWTSARTALWIPAFSIMGTACLLNARRCGRLHCHLTGPLFVLAALATALDAMGSVKLGWVAIASVAAAGTGLAFGVEHIRGLYVSR
jgi:hypothetical protein